MILKLDNLVYVTEDAVKIEKLKDLGAVEVEESEANVVEELDKVADEDENVADKANVVEDFSVLSSDEMKAVLDKLDIEYKKGATKTQLEELYNNYKES